jgi:hypothetical protein
MASSGMLRHVSLVRTDVWEQCSASFIRVTKIRELETTLALISSVRRSLVTTIIVPSSTILVSLMMEALSCSDKVVLTRATRRNTPEDGNLYKIVKYLENVKITFYRAVEVHKAV